LYEVLEKRKFSVKARNGKGMEVFKWKNSLENEE
jgi:hypothetical protein